MNKSIKSELVFAVGLTLCAAFLAINDMGSSKYGDEEVKLTNEKSSYYQWYHSKSIKQTIAEGHSQLMQLLLSSGSIKKEMEPSIQKLIKRTNASIRRYKGQKREILLGSRQLPKSQWFQTRNGKLGQVVGAKELEKKLIVLNRASAWFEFATLFFQLSLVAGAIGILLINRTFKRVFMAALFITGTSGTFCMLQAYLFL